MQHEARSQKQTRVSEVCAKKTIKSEAAAHTLHRHFLLRGGGDCEHPDWSAVTCCFLINARTTETD